MNVTIIPVDNFVSVDGVGHHIDLSAYDFTNVHAIQFSGGSGEIEHVDGSPPTIITALGAYQSVVAAHAAHVLSLVPPEPTAADVLADKLALLSGAYEAAMAFITSGYTKSQIETFTLQALEAEKYRALEAASPGSPPTLEAHADQFLMLSGMATATGQTLLQRVEQVEAKAEPYKKFTSLVTGKLQALQAVAYSIDLDAVDAIAQIGAIDEGEIGVLAEQIKAQLLAA